MSYETTIKLNFDGIEEILKEALEKKLGSDWKLELQGFYSGETYVDIDYVVFEVLDK